MSTKGTIVCAEVEDGCESIHVYDECFDKEHHVYVEYINNDGIGSKMFRFCMSRDLWGALVDDIRKGGTG